MKLVAKLKEVQNEELNNNFPNGDLWNELDSLINKIEREEKQKHFNSLDGSQIVSISLGL